MSALPSCTNTLFSADIACSLQSSEYVSSLLDVSISPDAYEPWPHSYQTLLTWALVPAADDTLK